MAAMNVSGFRDHFWTNGSSPGAFHDFPGSMNTSKSAEDISLIKRTLYPVTTGTSVLGLKFDGGVLMAADTLVSYGSLARFRGVSRLMAVGNNTAIGGSGDYADFQYIKSTLEKKVIEDACLNDGHGYTPKSIFSWLTRVMYYRRSKFDPLWNQIIVGGVHDGESFLGCVDKIGVAFESPTVSTGFGAYLAQPILRNAFEQNPSMSCDQARQVVINCLRVLFYRDARSLNKYEVAVITKDGVVIEPVQSLVTNWDIASMVKGYE
ncbi:proteasome subunit beta type-4-like [Montipora capricornis]|uniref:proteasome subunit beta type-4-like n=1 Tax=Montipora capricornis TaxID=246305 RepID=UPI0035F18251